MFTIVKVGLERRVWYSAGNSYEKGIWELLNWRVSKPILLHKVIEGMRVSPIRSALALIFYTMKEPSFSLWTFKFDDSGTRSSTCLFCPLENEILKMNMEMVGTRASRLEFLLSRDPQHLIWKARCKKLQILFKKPAKKEQWENYLSELQDVFRPQSKSNHIVTVQNIKLLQIEDNSPLLSGDESLFVPCDHHGIARQENGKMGVSSVLSAMRESSHPLIRENLSFKYL